MGNQEDKMLTLESYIDEEVDKRLNAKNARKELKLILITFAIILTSFLTFTYFFLDYIEEKASSYKLQHKQKEMNKTK
ncbi:RC1041 family protein [Rickettsia typhi]|uniref:Uncharacterized protein n=2 Tax=Rickettsia typhi TaxID=785 RepID=Q68X92_RICTY|nr:hypothetical protein [Rickettsia typhi]AAU03750.1 rickettsial conserved hypothetical protein [Rickettsia typhi str. Wilmington]AFE54127.1 hypothetical protein RTTH1527_01310 [Rickettsia typhi str. TH1527]AFE54966.1 hypothetical protein RTB9991CWPP_01315 [Rickettsia typhi str. B9991CWPP]